MLAYILKSAIVLALLYSCFFALLSRETLHRFNRCALLTILLASLTLPLVRISVERPLLNLPKETIVAQAKQNVNQHTLVFKDSEIAEYDDSTEFSVNSGKPAIYWLALLYLAGFTAAAVLFLVRLTLLIGALRGGLRHTDQFGNTVILRSGKQPPFSIFRFIVMSVDDYETHRREILTHEQAHIRLGHTYDILLLECVKALQWFNPFIYMLGRDLLAVHEYEADEAVINQGIDATKYQQLLVIKVVGNRLQPFANNLSRSSLKKRITMMHQTKSRGSHALKALLAIPVAAVTLYAFATPKSDSGAPFSSDKLVTINTDCETKPLVTYSTDLKFPAYIVNLCEGTLVTGDRTTYIEEITFAYLYPDNHNGFTTTMQLDGKTFDKNNLPKLTNKDLHKIEVHSDGKHQTVNLITTPVTIPAGVKGNCPSEMTLLLPAKDEVYVFTSKVQPGDWMTCSISSWDKSQWNYCVKDEFFTPSKKPGFKVYIYASTEATQRDIDRAKQMMTELSITNYELRTNIPVRHYTDDEVREMAQKQKAKGVAYNDVYSAMAPSGMTCADVKKQWHIVKAVYGRK